MRFEPKIVTVGISGVGKTCLVERMYRDKFNAQKDSTIGAAFVQLKNKDGKIYGLWDTAGNERYSTLLPIYIRESKVALVCFQNVREEFEKIKDNIRRIRDIEPRSKIILVETKCDLEKDQNNCYLYDEIRTFSDDKTVYKTSAKTGEGVKELVDMLFSLSFGEPKPVEDYINLDIKETENKWLSMKSCCAT